LHAPDFREELSHLLGRDVEVIPLEALDGLTPEIEQVRQSWRQSLRLWRW